MLLGSSRVSGAGLLTGELTDCSGAPVANAIVRVFGDSGEVAWGSTASSLRDFYCNGSAFPTAGGRHTDVDGLYGARNLLRPPSGVVRVELWGRLSAGAPLQKLACERVPVAADGVSLLNAGPLRSDAPSGC